MAPKNGSNVQALHEEAFEFFASEETTTIYLTPQYWVRLKNELDYGAQNELDNAAVTGFSTQQARKAAAEGETVIHTDLGRQRLLKIALFIDDWSLPGPDKKTMRWPRSIPERVAVVRTMKPKLAQAISDEIDRLIGARNEALQAEGYDAEGAGAEETDPTKLAVVEGKVL
jgi:hypothetical protein